MSRKKKILVVDDDPTLADPLEILLNLNGYETSSAYNGKDAFEKAVEDKPDLILLDIMMPKLNGIDTCQLIKENPSVKNIPIVMLTAFSQMDDIEKAFAAGAVDYLIKPFDSERLIEKVQKHLGQ